MITSQCGTLRFILVILLCDMHLFDTLNFDSDADGFLIPKHRYVGLFATAETRRLVWVEGSGRSRKLVTVTMESPTSLVTGSEVARSLPSVGEFDKLRYMPRQKLYLILQVKIKFLTLFGLNVV